MAWKPPADKVVTPWKPPPDKVESSEDYSLKGFGKNILEDVKETGKGALEFASSVAKDPLVTLDKTVRALPGAVTSEAERLGLMEFIDHPLGTGHLKKFGQALYDKPLTTITDVLGAVEGAGSLGKAAKGARGAEVVAKVAPEAASLADDAARSAVKAVPDATPAPVVAPEAAPAAPPPMPDAPVSRGTSPATFEEAMGLPERPAPGAGAAKFGPDGSPGTPPPGSGTKTAKPSPLEGMGEFLEKRYAGMAQKPGAAEKVSTWLKRMAQNLAADEVGFSPAQKKHMGEKNWRATAQYALDKGIIKGTELLDIGGDQARVKAIKDAARESLGQIRKAASESGVQYDKQGIVDAVVQKFGEKYSGKGANAGELSDFKKALEEIDKHPSTAEGVARMATALNKEAQKAEGLSRTSGAFRDVADTLSRMNDENIVRSLPSDVGRRYIQALDDYSATSRLEMGLARKSSRSGRIGPGGIVRGVAQKFLDSLGYKFSARAMDRFAKFIEKNPERLTDLPGLFREFITEVKESADDIELAHGGIIPDDMGDFLEKRYGGKHK